MSRANRDEPSAPEQVAAVLAQLGIEAARSEDDYIAWKRARRHGMPKVELYEGEGGADPAYSPVAPPSLAEHRAITDGMARADDLAETEDE